MTDPFGCGKVIIKVFFILFTHYNFDLFLVNYLKHWKCASILNGKDGSQSPQDSSINPSVSTTPSTTLATTKYYKRGNLSHPNEVLLH